MLCAIYTRLSREDADKQQPESESIQNQKSLLVHYAVERGWDIYQIYCDEDYSGADSLRPDFNRMIESAQEGRFQVILCKSQSRFTRDMELVEKYIHGLFPLWGVRFVAVADNADSEVKGNKKARQINGLVNEWYLEDLSENVRAVLDMKRRQGQYIGSSPIYGYQKDPRDKNRILVDPEAAAVVREIFRWSLAGHGRQNIAHMLNGRGVASPARYKAERGWPCGPPGKQDSGLWNKTTIWRILHNEMYTGVMVQGRRKKVSYKSKTVVDVPADHWYRVEGTHEPIIDRDTFDAVQQGLTLRTKSDGTGEPHLFSGLVRCMDCGSTMNKTANSRIGHQPQAYLRCKRYADSGIEKLCTRHSIRLDRLIDQVSDRIRRYVRNYYTPQMLPPSQPERCQETIEREQKYVEVQIKKHDRALQALYLDKVSGLLSAEQFERWKQSFQREKVRLERRLMQLNKELAKPQSSPLEQMVRVRELLSLKAVPRELVVALVEKIEVGEKNPETGQQEVRVTWKF